MLYIKFMETIEIDLEVFSKDELINLIEISIEKNLTFNDLIVKILEDYIKNFDTNKKEK